jgi:hypothetical protein
MLASVVENLGASAYLGQAGNIQSKEILAASAWKFQQASCRESQLRGGLGIYGEQWGNRSPLRRRPNSPPTVELSLRTGRAPSSTRRDCSALGSHLPTLGSG